MEPRFNLFGNELATKFAKRFAGASLVIAQSPLPTSTQQLVALRASQINGCGWCVDMHTKDAAAAGETAVRLSLVAAWREATVFTEAEQAALALAEEGTRLADASPRRVRRDLGPGAQALRRRPDRRAGLRGRHDQRGQPDGRDRAPEGGFLRARDVCQHDGVSDARFRSEQAGSFGLAAGTYDRGRPGYPEEAVAWLVPPGARRVLDLGAGTGQLTRQLAARGLEVVAVEPSDGMREQLARSLPSVPVLGGSAEDIPLGDGATDAVLVAQAWHWVDVERAVPEVARVLAPAGRLGLVWNVRDERVGWVAELGRIMHRGAEQDMGSTNPRVGAPFGPIERHDVEWVNPVTLDTLLELVRSRSYIITLPAEERASVLTEVRELVARGPELAGRPTIDLPYVTRCSRATQWPASVS